MRGGIKPVAASVALALTWALGTDPGLESASPLGPASAHAGAEAGPPAARSLRLGDEAVTRRDYAAADALYRVALSVPAHREVASSRLHALHDLGAFDLSADEPQLRELEGWLGPRFRRYETEHFVVLSDAGRQGALARGRTMERARHQFFRVMERLGFPVVPPKNKLVCVFFERHQDYAAFAKTRDNVDTGWIAGYYTGLGNRVVFYDDATSPRFLQARDAIRQYHATLEDARERATDARRGRDRESADRLAAYADDLQQRIAEETRRIDEEAERISESKTIHETIHLLAFNTGLQSRARLYPFWFTEGLAAAFETESPHASFGPDRPTHRRIAEFEAAAEDGRLTPLSDFIRLTDAGHSHAHARTAEALYAQAYALFTHLFEESPTALRWYVESIHREPAGEISPERHAELFEQGFGSPGAIERRLLSGLR